MQQAKQEIEKEFKKLDLVFERSLGVRPFSKGLRIEVPPENIDADLAVPCFEFAKQLKKAPQQIAQDLAAKVKPRYIIQVKALGPYLNFYIDWKKYGQEVLQDVDKNYGRGKRKGKYLVEFAHPNTHKAYHIGHVRNISLGESICRILEFSGLQVVRANYQGDIGPHVAKCLWGLLNLKQVKPASSSEGGKWLGEVYAAASKKVKEDKKVEEEVRQINKDLYAGKPDLVKLWKKTRKWSLDYFDQIYKDFGAKFDRFYFESEVESPGIKLAKELEKKGIAKQSEGAIVMDLKEHGLGVYVLLTQDQTPLYSIKDFVLADLQDKEYKPDKIVHVVASEQDLHFKQLFKSLEKINPKVAKKEYHLSYNLVTLPSGKMSSREGNVILYEDLKEEMYKIALKITKENLLEKGSSKTEKELERISWMVALGALKYSMVSHSPEKEIVFDWDRAVDFQGDTAPYIQYTYARARSILRKASGKYKDSELKEKEEIALLKKLSEFPEVLDKAAQDLRPHYVANYVFDLATLFNQFYQSIPVLKSDNKNRLALVDAVSVVIKKALWLIGIEAPEEM